MMVAVKALQNAGSLEKRGIQAISETGSNIDLNNRTRGQLSLDLGENKTQKVHCLLNQIYKLRKAQEEQKYQLKLPTRGDGEHIGVVERDSAITTLKSMQRFYNYDSETLATAANYMDRFISRMKVKRRYMSCVAAASFFLATKMNEEAEFHPTATDLASLNRLSWKPSDLKRMEKIILEKLEWKLFPAVTSLAYLEVIYKSLETVNSGVNHGFLKMLVERSELYMNYTNCSMYSACTLALCTAHECLKEASLNSLVNNFILLHIQSICQIPDSEYLECQCALSRQYELYNLHPQTHPRCLPLPKMVPRPSLVTRPSCYGNTDLPTIQENSNCEISEDDQEPVKSYVSCRIINYLPYSDTQKPPRTTQSYCLLLDQCLSRENSFSLCNAKCNISIL